MATIRQVSRHEVFPTLGLFVIVGTTIGAASPVIINMITGLPDGQRLVHCALSAGLGAIIGVFLGLGRGIWCLAEQAPAGSIPTEGEELWDAWVDNNNDGSQEPPDVFMTANISAKLLPSRSSLDTLPITRAHVRPRIVSPITGETIPLNEQVGQVIEQSHYKRVALMGRPGSGKSTAIRHLKAVLPPWALEKIVLIDDQEGGDALAFPNTKDHRLVISTRNWQASDPGEVVFYSLASWGQDDVIEYLLSMH